jgi:L-rhamnose isomerase
MCEALPLFVNMLEWVQDSQDVFKKVNDSAQRSNFDPAMLETCLKLDKSIHDLIHSVIDVQTLMADPTLQPGEQILEFFMYLDAGDWVPFLKNAFLNDVRYNFDEEAYWSRKGA